MIYHKAHIQSFYILLLDFIIMSISWKKTVLRRCGRSENSSQDQNEAPFELPSINGAHGGVLPPLRGAMAAPPLLSSPFNGNVTMPPPVSGSVVVSPSLGYVVPPPLMSKPAGATSSRHGLGSVSEGPSEGYQPVDRLDDVTKKLAEANERIRDLRLKMVTLEKDLAVAKNEKLEAIHQSMKIKVSPFCYTFN